MTLFSLTEISQFQILKWLSLSRSKYYNWRERYGIREGYRT